MSGADEPDNPCPFLRAMVAHQVIPEEVAPLPQLSRAVAAAVGDGDKTAVARPAIYLIGLIGSGLTPAQLFSNAHQGLRGTQLRGGPLDKRGSGSRVITQEGEIDIEQLDRLDAFATDVQCPISGVMERGLRADDLVEMMDANFERARPTRRPIDRELMKGEWPVLLQAMGKGEGDGRYLSISELRTLFIDKTLPERVLERIRDDSPD